MIIFVVMCLLYTHNLWVTRYVQLDIKQTPYCSRVQKSPHDQQDKAPLSLSLSFFLPMGIGTVSQSLVMTRSYWASTCNTPFAA